MQVTILVAIVGGLGGVLLPWRTFLIINQEGINTQDGKAVGVLLLLALILALTYFRWPTFIVGAVLLLLFLTVDLVAIYWIVQIENSHLPPTVGSGLYLVAIAGTAGAVAAAFDLIASPRPELQIAALLILVTCAAIVGVLVASGRFQKERLFVPSTTTTTTTPVGSTLPSTSAPPASTTSTVVPLSRCIGSGLGGSEVASRGFAGTVEDTFSLTDQRGPCILSGYPDLQLIGSGGAIIATATADDHTRFTIAIANLSPTTQRLEAGTPVTFLVEYSQVPVGTEESCPTSSSVDVYVPASAAPVSIDAPLGPCDGALVHVSPFYGAT